MPELKIEKKQKEGFKKIKLKSEPKDWKLINVKEFGKVVTGNTPSTGRKDYYGGDYIFVSPSDLNVNKNIFTSEKKLTKIGFETGRLIPKGSVLFVSIGSTIGKTGYAERDLITNQQINSVIPNESNNGDFIYYQLTYNAKRFSIIAGNQAVPILNKTTFENIKVLQPPLPEQQKIATILSTWDKAIDQLTQLIEAKEYRKKGLMQQLLTGKKRFEGFNGKQDTITIGKYIDQLTGFAFKSNEFNQEKKGIRLCRGVNISKGFLRFDHVNEMYWNGIKDNLIKYSLNEKDIVISMDGSLVGRNFAQISKKHLPLLLVQRVARLRAKNDLNQTYLYHWISSSHFIKYVDTVKTSSGIPHISSKDINSFKINLPKKEEQQKISSVLSAADQEIELLKNELLAMEVQKRGLMQQLLTGKIRIKF